MSKIGQQWRRFRKKHLFTQASLAAVLGITDRCIRKIEAGEVTPQASTQLAFEALKSKYRQEKEFWKTIREEHHNAREVGN